jgi:hypothetical protein
MIYKGTLVAEIFYVNNFYIGNCQEFPVDTLMTLKSSVTLNKYIYKSQFCIWRWQVCASSHNSNKLTNQMQQFYKFITWRFVFAQHVSDAYTPIIRSLKMRWESLVFSLERGGSSVDGRGLARPRPTTLLPPRSKVKPEAVNAVVSSWWWTWRRPKHVERNKSLSNKVVKLLHLVHWFIWIQFLEFVFIV